MNNAGLPLSDSQAVAPPDESQRQKTQAMQAAAHSVAHFQEEAERAQQVYVGYSLQNVPPESKQYWVPVTFDPFRPPKRFDTPVIDPNDPSPMADHHPVLEKVKPQSYHVLLEAYNLAWPVSVRS